MIKLHFGVTLAIYTIKYSWHDCSSVTHWITFAHIKNYKLVTILPGLQGLLQNTKQLHSSQIRVCPNGVWLSRPGTQHHQSEERTVERMFCIRKMETGILKRGNTWAN